MTILSSIACFLANIVTAAICIAMTIIFFVGIPGLRSIPFIGSVPIVGYLAEGEIARRQSVVLESYVKLSEAKALEAKLNETRRQLSAGADALDDFRRQQEAQERLDAEEKITQSEGAARYAQALPANKRDCRRIDQSDVDFLLRDKN